MKSFYENTTQIDESIIIEKPTDQDLQELLGIISDDSDLALYFYKTNTNAGWLSVLNGAGEFDNLADSGITNDFLLRMKAHYLVEASKQQAKDVIDLILKIGVKDWFIQSILLDVLSQKPLEIVQEGTDLIKSHMGKEGHIEWYMAGERSAKFMIAIAEEHPDKAFEIAEVLLGIYKTDNEIIHFRNTKSKFGERDYEDFIFKYYRKLWESHPFKATKLLVDIFNNYLGKLESNDFDLTSGFRCSIERLDQVAVTSHKRIVKVIVQAICESGRVVIEKEPERTDELLDYLVSFKQIIFERIEMYLLRFVPKKTQKERIDAIIGNTKFLDDDYLYEYRLLLRDNFEDISDEAKKVFTNWVEGIEIKEEERKRINKWYAENKDNKEKPDFDKGLIIRKAKQLSLLREQFSELYGKYKSESGSTDKELELEPRISEIRTLSGKEGTPLSEDDMLKMEPIAVIDYICNTTKWVVDKKNEWRLHPPKEALSQVFEDVVKSRAEDYASLELKQLQRLEPVFLERYYNGICNSFREDGINEKDVLNVLVKSESIVTDNFESSDHEWTFRLILDIIEKIFNIEQLKKSLVPANSTLMWYIIEKLTSYDDKREDQSGERDPHQQSINCVAGKAFILVIRFGLFFRNLEEKDYNENWSNKMKSVITHVIDDVKAPKIRSVLGVHFPQLHWLEKELIEKETDKIFDIADDKMWKDIWGSYLSWSRAYKNIFTFLAGKGKYAHAIGKIGTFGEALGFAKNIDEGLVQHLTIAYFNKWIEWGNPLLKQFFKDAPPESRGKAADFLENGFSAIHEENDAARMKEMGERVKLYWEKRIEAMSLNPELHREEAIEFIGWIKDTLIGPKETLELTLQTLEITGGELGRNRDEVKLAEGACKIGEGNELLALKCMNKMMEGKPEWMSFSIYEKKLKAFLEHVVGLGDETTGIRDEAKKLVNAYGRRGIDNLKSYYDRLSATE